MAINDDQRAIAIDMMKNDRPPEAVHARLVEMGAANDEVYAFISELMRLKNEAAARDPARLREEAKWILIRGGTVEDVVAAFGAVGVLAEHARPEAERMLAVVRTMRPCMRCRSPMMPNEVMFDVGGNSVCPRCHTRDEIVRSEQRGIVSEMENLGMVSPLMGLAIASMVERSQAPPIAAPEYASGPVCPRCRAPALVSTSTLPPHHAAASSGAAWICRNCNGTS